MSIKDHALLVSLTVSKPQMTAKDSKATHDAESANNASGAGHYRKDLYPKALVAPIVAIEAAARAYIASQTYMWNRGEYLLPTTRFMAFADRIAKFELEFNQSVTAFLNNWSNVMQLAQSYQGDLFDASAYPDLSDLKADFRFRVHYRPVTDAHDFRVDLQEEELDALRQSVEEATKDSLNSVLRQPLERLRDVVARLNEVTKKGERTVINKKTGATDIKAPIFRDSVIDNIMEEINLLHDFAAVLPDDVVSLAADVVNATPHAQTLRDNPAARTDVGIKTDALLASINSMLDA
jgi:hypothetical protein